MNCSNTTIPTLEYFVSSLRRFTLAKPNRFIVSNPSGVAITEPQDLQEAQSLLASVDDETPKIDKTKNTPLMGGIGRESSFKHNLFFDGGQLLLIEMLLLFPLGFLGRSKSWCHQNKMSASKT